ncbi:MAG: helix-hairpin-helix domain-containing protein [bacterium]
MKRQAKRYPSRNCPDRECGTVLVIVLWIALGLVSVALYFGHSMMLEYRAADNSIAGLESAQAIEGARRYVQFVLTNLEEAGTMPDIETYESEQVMVGDAVFWLLGRGSDDVSEDTPVYGLVDEASKLNLNTATIEMLEALPCMTTELAAAIIDWRDSDAEVSPEGAESEAYLLRDPKYNCKDSPFETIEELRLVMGGEWEILYREDANRNGILDSNENDGDESLPDDNRDSRLDAGVLEYVTVYSRELNVSSDGSDRINIQSNDQQQLSQLLQETFGEDRANQIQQAVGSSQQNINSVLEYQVRSGMTPDEFAQIADMLTVSDEDSIQGLVNVNTASAEVLASIPGIGEEYASQLVAYRQGKTDELDTVAWVAEVLNEENAIQAGPYITTKSYQFTADIVALGHEGRGFQRVLFVFDTTGDEPIVVYRRDLGRLGWPLGVGVRNQLAYAMEKRW